MSAHETILAGLNAPQREAVERLSGPLLILAGAGSGKTRVITHRIAWGVATRAFAPSNVFAVTFTNKAAGEMLARVGALLNGRIDGIWVRTFHAACAAILRTDGRAIGIGRFFSIYDSADQQELAKEVLQSLDLGVDKTLVSLFTRFINRSRDGLLSFAAAAESLEDGRLAEAFVTAAAAYEKRLAAADALDFGAILERTVRLFTECPEILARYRERFSHVLVDEYQDTNQVQYRLVRLLTEESRNLCVVGDDDQSIYRWRGADINNILDFEKDYPEARVVKLEQNYRSSPEILALAAAVIARNRKRMAKTVFSDLPTGGRPLVFSCEDGFAEAATVAAGIEELVAAGVPHREIAVFYRTNWQSRAFEETFLRRRIPYVLTGGLRFYERREVKELLAWLRLAVNPRDERSFARAVQAPSRGIGKKTIDAVLAAARAADRDILSICRDGIPGAKGKRAGTLLAGFATAVSAIEGENDPAAAVDLALAASGLRAHYETAKEEVDRLGNIDEFVNAVRLYAQEHPGHSLGDFLVTVALVSDADTTDDAARAVQLMTIHNAKGLEFDAVFITGLEEGLFPHYLTEAEDPAAEEERRLFYVGATRARRHLFLSHAASRHSYGRLNYAEPSRFLAEIPEALLADEADETLHGRAPAAGAAASDRPHRERPGHSGAPQATAWQVFQPGERVRHAEYGEGLVLSRSGEGEMAALQVDFSGKGCLFLERYVRLERVE